MIRNIGNSLREAINWAQDMLHTTRPIAESTILSAIEAKTIIWDDGVVLLEDDDEVEDRKKSTIQSTQKNFNAAKKWSRIQFRNHKRSGRNSLKSVHKQAASKFSDVAESMLSGGLKQATKIIQPPSNSDDMKILIASQKYLLELEKENDK